jgi:hypothetical protein
MQLGQELDISIVSGGDRHGLEPNSILNLSCAASFSEFVHEVRRDRQSHILLMPQYREPHKFRILRMIAEILREYPNMPGRETWADRVFLRRLNSGVSEPLSSILKRSSPFPKCVNGLAFLLQGIRWPGIRWALQLASGANVPSALIPDSSYD